MTKEIFIFDIFCEQISLSTRELLNKEDVPQKAIELLQKVQALTEGIRYIRVEVLHSPTRGLVHKEEYKADKEFSAPLKVIRPILWFPEGRIVKKADILKFFTHFGVAELQKYQYIVQAQEMLVGDTTIVLVAEEGAMRIFDEKGAEVLKAQQREDYALHMFSPLTSPLVVIQATQGWDETRQISYEDWKILTGNKA